MLMFLSSKGRRRCDIVLRNGIYIRQSLHNQTDHSRFDVNDDNTRPVRILTRFHFKSDTNVNHRNNLTAKIDQSLHIIFHFRDCRNRLHRNDLIHIADAYAKKLLSRLECHKHSFLGIIFQQLFHIVRFFF